MGKDFVVDYDSLHNMIVTSNDNYGEWMNEFSELEEKINAMITNSYFTGDGAEALKGYLNDVHLCIAAGIKSVIVLHNASFECYFRDLCDRDGAISFYISSEELDEISSALKASKTSTDTLNGNVKQIVSAINDIVAVRRPSVEDIDGEIDRIVNRIDRLKENITQIDTEHRNNDFTETENLIKSTNNFINSCKKQGRTFKTDYSSASLSQISSWSAFADAAVEVGDKIQNNSETYEIPKFTLQKHNVKKRHAS